MFPYARGVRVPLRPPDRQPDPPPLRTDDRRPVLVGTLVWAALLAVGLWERDRLEAGGDGWWVGTALAGVLLGAFGLAYLHARRPRPGPPHRDR